MKVKEQDVALPEVTRFGVLDMQVCVPEDFTDEQAIAFAEKEYECGTINGWFIRRTGDPLLLGKNERVKCKGREGFVHIMLDA